MGIVSRVKTIVKSNVNDLKDKWSKKGKSQEKLKDDLEHDIRQLESKIEAIQGYLKQSNIMMIDYNNQITKYANYAKRSPSQAGTFMIYKTDAEYKLEKEKAHNEQLSSQKAAMHVLLVKLQLDLRQLNGESVSDNELKHALYLAESLKELEKTDKDAELEALAAKYE